MMDIHKKILNITVLVTTVIQKIFKKLKVHQTTILVRKISTEFRPESNCTLDSAVFNIPLYKVVQMNFVLQLSLLMGPFEFHC